MEELDHSGLVLDKHHMEFEILGSNIPEGLMKIVLTGFKRNIHILEETQYKNKFPMLTDRQNHVSNIACQHQ